jgi:pimeloyl-ACP methyl ester carboxylesterase
MNSRSVALWLVLLTVAGRADGPTDNLVDKVRPVPPPGLAIHDADRAELTESVAKLGQEIEQLREQLSGKRALVELLPDVQIFEKAVRWALVYNEFFKSNETQVARALVWQGLDRAKALREGHAPWLAATGLVVRGYSSRIDGSIQPYGLVVPASFHPNSAHSFRLDLWFHGRGETLTELDFLNQRQKSAGEFAPVNALVLHTYGRYCNGSKFAGETDTFEALAHVRKFYPIDEDRIVVRGFSLGGAACWHTAVHHAWLWAAAAPGAGFSETPDFLKVFQNERLQPSWFEQKLWHLYDGTDWALNLAQCPTVAYSGEIDRQKQAADVMASALAREGIELVHIIGPNTAHSYHAESKNEINRRIDSLVARGRNPVPQRVHFTTWTLRYNRMNWVVVDGLEEHWTRANAEAELDLAANTIRVTTKNISALTLTFEPGLCPLDNTQAPLAILDGQKLSAPRILSDKSWTASFRKNGSRWEPTGNGEGNDELRKRHGLQGPIDDAFMDSFLMVRSTASPLNEKVGTWAIAELAHATNQWRQQFRGDARVKDDTAVTDEDIAAHNLVLWGDPSSNRLLARIADKLPIHWTAREIRAGKQAFPSDHHAPVLVYPNPLNPRRYVVLNSSFTFREYDYLNNARQVPKLPDYAVIDLNVPVSSRASGGIAVAGFFDESWRLTGPNAQVGSK